MDFDAAYLEDRINALAISGAYMEHLGDLALLLAFWNIIKQCSKALCARGKGLVIPSCRVRMSHLISP